jgi:hypothetical protein
MSSLHQIRVQAVRLERYSRRVEDEIWAGDRQDRQWLMSLKEVRSPAGFTR